MRTLRPAGLYLVLAAAAATTTLAQRGPGLARGFTDIGLGNWVLHESGADSIAAWYVLEDEHLARLERLALQFQSDNAAVLERWRNMQQEIQRVWAEDQYPTRTAIHEIGMRYDHPGLHLQPALERVQLRLAAILWLAHREYAVQPPFTGSASGRAVRPGYGRRRTTERSR